MNTDEWNGVLGLEECALCGGTGLALNSAGEPDWCRECAGDGVVEVVSAPASPKLGIAPCTYPDCGCTFGCGAPPL
jgi:DnaJ-class molecular chaperone